MVPGDEALAGLARDTGQALGMAGLRLATAESCTGGWIAKLLTDIAGSSAWFERGLVTYSNAAKTQLLGVPAGIIEVHGAVSEATVRAMAEGALNVSDAEAALAVSGIAGPGGGSPEKPVGTVWLAWAGKGRETEARRFLFPGDREAVRRQAVAAALEGLLARLSS
ncbi:CinA family protein [Thioalkalivibrio sulfidiphilus]|uniref:CinA domain protein n=1 Tax=Thioalkalivibrio sulfidiphilus (strain HL-EbGR7) TaxID=396588 RepID=B8GQV1_THISH|nr:nicotinamide-nucleotide amidohydrolase family protein [Thioalkalivibrio sulfidiphilus]ACL72371.1 CinA domain protein [Thioalkalivibrio sulfidiphilus HL-EbGr7]